MEGPKVAKRRLGDKTLPQSLTGNPAFAADSKMYQDLLDIERRLDWQMMRKKAEIQDTIGRPLTTTRTLRLFLSHTVSGQTWQTGGPSSFEGAGVNLETGEGVPAWQLKLEGRLLELPNQRAKDRPTARKLSGFIKRIFVELERDQELYPEGNTAELYPAPTGPELDGFTLRRTGDSLTQLKIVIDLKQTPDIFKVAEPLATVLGTYHETRAGIVQALWGYVKLNQLQDKVDRRMVRADDALRPIFGQEAVPFQALGDLCNRFIQPADPIVLHYTIDPSIPPPEKPQAWDVEVRMEDVLARTKMNNVVVNMSSEGTAELTKLDEEIVQHAQSIQNAQTKLTFLRSFADDPATFIDTWLASQSRDLDAVLGGSEAAVLGPGGHGGLAEDVGGNVRRVRAEELRRSEFFQLPWVEEAVAVQEGMRLARLNA